MRIKRAAIFHEGQIHEGPSHVEIGHAMLLGGYCTRPFPGGKAQGFVTECGKFVGRITAMRIALQAGQVTKGQTCHGTELFSEDLR